MAMPASVLSAIIDLFPLGIVVLNGRTQIVFANAAAQEILVDGRLIHSREGILETTSATYNRALAEAIERAKRSGSKGPLGFNMVRAGLPPVSVAVAAILPRDARSSSLGVNRLLVLISDPLQKISADSDVIGTLFDFTPKETVIAQKTLEGIDITDVAQELKLSTYTVRNHLKQLFSKTNTKKHAELLYTLLRSPAALRYRDSSVDVDKVKKSVTQTRLNAARAG
jgi:DNA-binding CsgD family transcriptional regulator